MKLFAPGYYKDFKCTASECKKSCCVGWEIDVDQITLEKYKCNRAFLDILSTVDMTDTPHFKLSEDERCPHLTPSGLCSIILLHSEDSLPEICREHPRFYNETVRGKEVGLGIVCEEASKIVLSSDSYYPLEVAREVDGDPVSPVDNSEILDGVFKILSDRSIPYQVRLKALYKRAGVSPDIHSDLDIIDMLLSSEIACETDSDLFSLYSSDILDEDPYELYLERFLAYLIYRHVSAAENGMELRASLGFAFVLERLFSSILRCSLITGQEDIERIASAISLELEYSEENTEAIRLEFFLN